MQKGRNLLEEFDMCYELSLKMFRKDINDDTWARGVYTDRVPN